MGREKMRGKDKGREESKEVINSKESRVCQKNTWSKKSKLKELAS